MAGMKTRLGVLGGMGPQATLAFYQRVLDMTQAQSDQEHLPALIWSDTQVPDRTDAILRGETEAVYAALLAGAQLLAREGCTVLAIPCNTSHYFADRLQSQVDIHLLHMVRLAVETGKAKGCRRLGILATEGTVRAGIYQAECTTQGIEGVVPGPEGQAAVTGLIYETVKRGLPGCPKQLDAVVKELRGVGCDGVVLACTELSVFRMTHGLPDFCIDAMDVLARASVLACGYPLRIR